MRRAGWKRVALIAAICGLLVACGGTSGKTEVFRPRSLVASDLYLRVHAPSGAMAVLAKRLRKTKTLGGFVVAPDTQGQEDCNFTREIPRNTRAGLRKYVGQKVTVRVYGGSRLAPSFCKGFGKAIGGGSAATAPRSHGSRCVYVDQVGVRDAKVFLKISVTPKRLEHSWCTLFRRHYHSPFSARRLQPSRLGAVRKYCAFAFRSPVQHVVLTIFSNRYFGGAVTCGRLRAFPLLGFHRVR